jgi:hypothetical protein
MLAKISDACQLAFLGLELLALMIKAAFVIAVGLILLGAGLACVFFMFKTIFVAVFGL